MNQTIGGIGWKKPLAVLAMIGLTAGCGAATAPVPAEQPVAVMLETSTTTTTAMAPTTTTTVPPTTTTTVCVPVNTAAQSAYLVTLRSAIDQTASGIDSIQLVIDNGIRSRDAAARYAAAVKADRDRAATAFQEFGGDTNRDKLAYQERRLADANGVVASWDATLTKARGDLSRARAQKADFEKKARSTSAEIAAARTAC